MSSEDPNQPHLSELTEQLQSLSLNEIQFYSQQEIMPLPPGVKLALPEPFSGVFDVAVLQAFFFRVERYFELTGVTDDHQKGLLLSLLVKDHAAVWLQSQSYNFQEVGYSDIKAEMLLHFTPADHERRARDALARCQQQHSTQVSGYITAFIKAAQRVMDLSEEEKLDRFLRGLRANVLEKVLMADVTSFADACRAAERASAILGYVQDRRQRPANMRSPYAPDTSSTGSHGAGPMVLGTMQPSQHGRRPPTQGQPQQYRRPSQQGSVRFQGQCFHCGKVGHMARNCWQRQAGQRSLQGARQPGQLQTAFAPNVPADEQPFPPPPAAQGSLN